MIYGPDNFYEANIRPIGKSKGNNGNQRPKRRVVWKVPAPHAEAIHSLIQGAHLPALGSKASLAVIFAAVSTVTGVSEMDMKSQRRESTYVKARFIFYACAREMTTSALAGIGRYCGNRDHSTVISGLARIDANMDYYSPDIHKVKIRLGMVEASQSDVPS